MKAVPTDVAEYKRAVRRVRAKVARWPSAYASGMVVQEYKRAMAKKHKPAYSSSTPKSKTDLARWFKEKWVDVRTGEPCGSVSGSAYPTCRPSKRVSSATPRTTRGLTKSQKRRMVEIKQRAKKKTASYDRVYKRR